MAPGRGTTRQDRQRIGPMVLRPTGQRKMPCAQMGRHMIGPKDAIAGAVNSVTVNDRPCAPASRA
jgi:hypothetical protein